MMDQLGEFRSLWATQTPAAMMELARLVRPVELPAEPTKAQREMVEQRGQIADYLKAQLERTPGAPWPMVMFNSGTWWGSNAYMRRPLERGQGLLTSALAQQPARPSERHPELGVHHQTRRGYSDMRSLFRLGLDVWSHPKVLIEPRPEPAIPERNVLQVERALWSVQCGVLRTWIGRIDAQGWGGEAERILELVDACYDHPELLRAGRAYIDLTDRIRYELLNLLTIDVNRVTLRRRFASCVRMAGTFEGLQAIAFSSGPISWGLTGHVHTFEAALPEDKEVYTEDHKRTVEEIERAVQLHNTMMSDVYTQLAR